MSYQQLRQSELFAGENWQLVYRAFTQINFQAYDFDTIRQSMVEYIQRNYPEDFNDWIENQELIFIIDLLAYLGQSLAFRVDLNSRENFLDTAERRESILKLARMLGYNPRRNISSRGLLKLQTVKTTEDIRDSNNNSLANVEIEWNDPTSQDWFEQFLLILNSSFATTNPFGKPVKEQRVGGINTQLYALENVPLRTVADGFSKTVNGRGMQFEIVNPDIDPLGFFYERTPDPLSSKHLIYRNDGTGNASPNTGFFAYFKQGEMGFSDFEFSFPEENRVVDINVENVNELDVWVQEINDSGLVINEWTKVPTVENISYNSVDRQIRNIFQVITRDNDQISIRFGDGRFGNSPTGLFRFWYRVSNGLSYQLQRREMQNIQIVIPYTKTISTGRTQEHDLTLTFSLEYGISNRDAGGSLPSESEDSVKQRAQQVYYTQNRMVNGEDYNIFPLQFGNAIRKVKSINRVYSGQSRYIDTNDPTGRYQNTSVFADDGIIYRELFNRSDFESLPTTKTAREIIETKIQTLLNEVDITDFFYTYFPRIEIDNNPHPVIWYAASNSTTSSTGEFRADVNGFGSYDPQSIGPGTPNNYSYLREGALVKMHEPGDPTNFKWIKIEQVSGAGIDPLIDVNGTGPVVISEPIERNWVVELVIPAFRSTLVTSEISDIEDEIEGERTFAIRYDIDDATWKVITTNNISQAPFSLTNAGSETETNQDSSWLMLAEYLPGQGFWRFTTRNLRYVFESEEIVRFFFVDDYKTVDVQRNLALRDFIKVLKYNTQASPSMNALGEEFSWILVKPFTYPDGYIEPRRVQISFTDNDSDGIPDDPEIFDRLVDPDAEISGAAITDRYVFQQKVVVNDYEYYQPISGITAYQTTANMTGDAANLDDGAITYVIQLDTFYEKQPDDSFNEIEDTYLAFVGRTELNFQWKHYAPSSHRIDPAITNIIDVYALTENYYQSVQNWLASVDRPEFPAPPTTDDLRIQFNELEKFKMVSDELVWHSAKFKTLFGDGATDELKATFKVIKVPGTSVTNNEIKQRVISAINEFFNIDQWNFGESFYYTELAAYIHQQLATIVGSVVIVPQKASSNFGNLFVVRSEPDELFLSTASVNEVEIVDNYTSGNIKIK